LPVIAAGSRLGAGPFDPARGSGPAVETMSGMAATASSGSVHPSGAGAYTTVFGVRIIHACRARLETRHRILTAEDGPRATAEGSE